MKQAFFQNARAQAAAVGVAAAVALFGITPLAQASALTSSQVDAIINLLQVFGADSATIANVQAALAGTPVSGAATSTPSYGVNESGNATGCASLSGTLSVGSEGEDVTKLQQFLSKDPSVYPEGLVTGYYGHATEDAVRRYQEAHGIVATGTPETTGYGIVGPSTRGELEREMETECGSGDSQQSSDNASSTPSHEGEGASATATSSAQSGGD